MKLPKIYEAQAYEADIYSLWEKTQAFKPIRNATPYSIVVPPPNANGDLHIGHALTLALQDIAIRYHRLKGDSTLFIPGADHAGFETQVVYERQLAQQGKSRFDFTREELYSQIYEFVSRNRDNYMNQFRRLGASVDWDYYTFTLDKKVVNQAYATFKKMWDEQLIYRGERLVNFCTFHGTAFADIEVLYKEEPGKLWYIRYPLSDDSGEVVVATSRPETMLGDSGVAVHPDDPRYREYVGKTITLPLVGRQIPIVADDFVDRSFGTGAVKLTPAHDPNDFEAAERHDLAKITVITTDGTISDEMPVEYAGLSIRDARKKIVDNLTSEKLLVKVEEYTHNVGHCYKCDTVIEPLLRKQWFVTMQPLAERGITALTADEITFYPEAKKQQLITYLENLRDWNISRQIAWGIPIPAFQNVLDESDWIYDERVDQESITVDGKTYRRDPDVFDTWFSSSSWPYATLDYPESDGYKQFYPLSLMETGFDILMPWVSRMLMLGLYTTGEIPFKEVYLHGLVLDEHGQKMSKSKGNVINPLTIVDEYGSDALRMGIISGQSAGNNQPFGLPKVVGARNFTNKLWNIARYIEDVVGDNYQTQPVQPKSAADHWLLSRLMYATQTIDTQLATYAFSEAYETLYHFIWDDLADWYIEASKVAPNLPLLAYALQSSLVLAHPFAPFVTETIWQTLNWEADSILAIARWPEIIAYNQQQASVFIEIQTVVSEARFIAKELGIKKANLHYTNAPTIEHHEQLIKWLAGLGSVAEVETGKGSGIRLTNTSQHCWIAVDRQTADRYSEQLTVKLQTQERVVVQLEGRLNNKAYVTSAPPHIVAQTKQQLKEVQQKLVTIRQEAERFSIED